MSKREEEGCRKWKNRSCKSRKNKKYATKCDRLAQELCALDRDKDSRAEREREIPSFAAVVATCLLCLSLSWTRHQSCKTRTRGFPEIEKVLKKTKKMLPTV